MTVAGTTNNPSRTTPITHRPTKQARLTYFKSTKKIYFQFISNRLRSLGFQQNHGDVQGPFIENCIGISPCNIL